MEFKVGKMGKKRKVETRAGAKAANEELVKMSPPTVQHQHQQHQHQQQQGNKRKKDSGSVTPRHQYPDSDCESGTNRCTLSK